MIDAATTKPPAFDVIVVHSFSRFFRDQFQLELYVRRLAKNGVRLVSITQELGDAAQGAGGCAIPSSGSRASAW
jgi:site-specific DNA recombinase